MQLPGDGDRPASRRDLVVLGDALYQAEAWRVLHARVRLSRAWRAARAVRSLRRGATGGTSPTTGRIDVDVRPAARPSVLVVDRAQPLWDRRAGALRTVTLLHAFKAAGAAVTLAYLDPRRHEPYTTELERAGIAVVPGLEALRRFLAQTGASQSLVCLTWPDVAAPLLAEMRAACPGALLAYDAIDLQHLRYAGEERVTGRAVGAARERGREARITAAVDVTLTVSDDEAAVVRSAFGAADVRTVPLLEAPRDRPVPAFAERSGVVFVGSYDHAPNRDGALWFLDAVLPALRRHVDVDVTFAGHLPPPELVARADARVHVAGWVPDVVSLLDSARVFVCPLRWGAGVKGKCVLALGNGIPLVSTTAGVAGMAVVDGVHALVRDDAEAFADAVATVHESPELWSGLSRSGMAYAAEHHGPEPVQRVVDGLLADALRRRAQ